MDAKKCDRCGAFYDVEYERLNGGAFLTKYIRQTLMQRYNLALAQSLTCATTAERLLRSL